MFFLIVCLAVFSPQPRPELNDGEAPWRSALPFGGRLEAAAQRQGPLRLAWRRPGSEPVIHHRRDPVGPAAKTDAALRPSVAGRENPLTRRSPKTQTSKRTAGGFPARPGPYFRARSARSGRSRLA